METETGGSFKCFKYSFDCASSEKDKFGKCFRKVAINASAFSLVIGALNALLKAFKPALVPQKAVSTFSSSRA